MNDFRCIHEITSKKVFGEIISDFCYNGQVRVDEDLHWNGITHINFGVMYAFYMIVVLLKLKMFLRR